MCVLLGALLLYLIPSNHVTSSHTESNSNRQQNPELRVQMEVFTNFYSGPYKSKQMDVNITEYEPQIFNETPAFNADHALKIVETTDNNCYYVTCTAPYLIKWVSNIPLKDVEDTSPRLQPCKEWRYLNSRRPHDTPVNLMGLKDELYRKNNRSNHKYTIQLVFLVKNGNMGLLTCESISKPKLSASIYFTQETDRKQVNYDSGTQNRDKMTTFLYWDRNEFLYGNKSFTIPCRATALNVQQTLLMTHNGIDFVQLWNHNNGSLETESGINVEYSPIIGFTLNSPIRSPSLFLKLITRSSNFGSVNNSIKFRCTNDSAQTVKTLFVVFLYSTENQRSSIKIVDDDYEGGSKPSGCYLIKNQDSFTYEGQRFVGVLRIFFYTLITFIQCNSPHECDLVRQCLDFAAYQSLKPACYSNQNEVISASRRLDKPQARGIIKCIDYDDKHGPRPIYEYTFMGLDRIRYLLSENVPTKAVILIEDTAPIIYTNIEATFRCHIALFVLVPNIKFAVLFINGSSLLLSDAHSKQNATSSDTYDSNRIGKLINSNAVLGTGWKDLQLNLTADITGIVCYAPLLNSTQWANATRSFVTKDVAKPKIDKRNDGERHGPRIFREGDRDFSLHCKATGAPEPEIKWIPKTLNSEEMELFKNLTEITNEPGKSVLKFSIVEESLAGIYTCFAENDHGNDSYDYVLEFEESGIGTWGIGGIVLAALACIGFLLGFGIMFLKYNSAKRQIRDLTDEEINEFNNGSRSRKHGSNEDIDIISMLPFKKELILAPSQLMIEQGAVLGQGRFGIVFRGLLDGTPVAVKTTKSTADVEYVKAFLGELKVMAYIDQHPHIVLFLGAVVNKIRERVVLAVVELCPLGNLQDYLKKFRLGTKESVQFINLLDNDRIVPQKTPNCPTGVDFITTLDLLEWCRQISLGMTYISSKKVFHGDLATRNVLVFYNKIVKLSDFGFSKQLYASTTYVKKNSCPLPWRWMALESLRFLEFSIQSDVWAFGITMWEILSLGETPYPGLTWSSEFVTILRSGMRMGKPQYCPKAIYDQMLLCWNVFPQERPQFPDILNFFDNFLQPFSSPSSSKSENHEEGVGRQAKSTVVYDSLTGSSESLYEKEGKTGERDSNNI